MGGTKSGAYVDKCVGNELSKTYGKKAAKELAKRGMKASGNIVTLSGILGKCLYKANQKF